MRTCLTILIPMMLWMQAPSTAQPRQEQPRLGYRSAALIEREGYRFKDLNRNGALDPYEDWRLTPEARSKDLVARMSVEQKAGFMLISTTRLENDWSFERPRNREAVTSGFNENDLVDSLNLFTKKPLPYPIMQAAGTTKGVSVFHLRHFILRANVSARVIADWSNRLQALCEAQPLGIPAIVASNPRNHITRDASPGLSVGRTGFTAWPGELGLSATRDLRLVRDFAEMARREWRAVGLRKGYMYMADLATEPRWQRIEGTFGEDAGWAAKMITEVVLGFQGTRLGPASVALTTKHFPGGGATEGGHDPHFTWGRNEVFPGGMFRNNLIPFQAAIRAGTSAIMPYYSIPNGTPYEKVAYAYNKGVLQGLLRGELGFDGIINSDTGPIEMMPWGAEHLSIEQRYQKTLQAGVNLYSGTADPTKLLATIRAGMVDMSLIDGSVHRLLLEKFRLGLFEDPYVDADSAASIVGAEAFRRRADEAFRKSIVLLRNDASSLPLKPGTRVYFERITATRAAANAEPSRPTEGVPEGIRIVETPEEADRIVLWLVPGAKSLFDADSTPLRLSLSANRIDVDRVRRLTALKPTTLVVNYTSPWVIDEVYDPASRPRIPSVLATFGCTPDALWDVLTGRFRPVGRMPFSTPVSEAAAARQLSDVPGNLEPKGYALFRFDEGLGYR
ncbi:MAG: glycoside hydrolase family 3 protein [Chitinophagia bacterium]|nr:glycoside hydrolase family 3 protein [Chitinophagia bacterium]